MGSPKSLVFIILASWICAPEFMAIHPIVIDIFQQAAVILIKQLNMKEMWTDSSVMSWDGVRTERHF